MNNIYDSKVQCADINSAIQFVANFKVKTNFNYEQYTEHTDNKFSGKKDGDVEGGPRNHKRK